MSESEPEPQYLSLQDIVERLMNSVTDDHIAFDPNSLDNPMMDSSSPAWELLKQWTQRDHIDDASFEERKKKQIEAQKLSYSTYIEADGVCLEMFGSPSAGLRVSIRTYALPLLDETQQKFWQNVAKQAQQEAEKKDLNDMTRKERRDLTDAKNRLGTWRGPRFDPDKISPREVIEVKLVGDEGSEYTTQIKPRIVGRDQNALSVLNAYIKDFRPKLGERFKVTLSVQQQIEVDKPGRGRS